MESFKDDLALGLFTLDKTLEPNHRVPPLPPTDLRESLLPPAKFLNTSVKKKPYYVMVPAKETVLKKKINGDIRE